MSRWSESTLRSAASWQAFKAGSALCAAGTATVTRVTADSFHGTVRDGKRLHRVSVRTLSPSTLETRCSCPENQASGTVCPHAVAVGLASLRPAAEPAAAKPATTSPPPPPAGWTLHFPPNWADSLRRGKLSATLTRTTNPCPADTPLAAWLASQAAPTNSPLHLQLNSDHLPGFLAAIADHPHLTTGPNRTALEIHPPAALPLTEITHLADHLRLVPASETIHLIAGSLYLLAPAAITRIGPGTVPAALATPLAQLAAGQAIEIPTQQFLSQLPIWQEWLAFPPDSWLDSLHFLPAHFTTRLQLDGSLQRLDAQVLLLYPGSDPVPPGLSYLPQFPRLVAQDQCEIRDLDHEVRATATLAQAGFSPSDPAAGRWSLSNPDAIATFITHTLPSLRRSWDVTESSRFQSARQQIIHVLPKIEILASGDDWLDFDLSFESTDGRAFPAAEIRRLLRSGKGRHLAADGRQIFVSNDISELIDPILSELDVRQQEGRYTAPARAGELIRALHQQLNSSASAPQPPELPLPPTIQAALRPYQSHGVDWLWDRLQRFDGALLADDMGLGKTIQTIVLSEHLFHRSPAEAPPTVLIVATASLLGNWRAEFAKFAPARPVHILHGQGRDARRDQIAPGTVLITTYATLARDLAWHLRRDYDLVVVDEASLMRNPDTDHAKALAKLPARRRIALTGTPIENGVRDLWSIFRFLLPGWLGTRDDFRARYEVPLQDDPGPHTAALLQRLRLKTAPFTLRRTKDQVAPELPSKILIDEFCDLTIDQQSVYRDLQREGRRLAEASQDAGQAAAARMRVLTALLRLRQTCCDLALLGGERFPAMPVPARSAKLQRLLELLEEALAGGHKVLVFSQFQTQLRAIEAALQARSWASLRLDGQTTQRQALVDAFQAPDGPPIFLISLKAGGYGLNLTAADIVIHFDPWWNPAAEAQATDRAHRIGQTRPVTVYRLLTRGTVEEKVLRLQARKRHLATALDDADPASPPGQLTDSDLRDLLTEA